MKTYHLALGLIMMISFFAKTIWSEPTPTGNEIAKANNAFAIDLYSQLAKQPGNLVVSPFSIDTALAMAYAGARGNTAKQMADVLHFANGDTNVHVGLSALLKYLQNTNALGCQLDVANALWAQQGYPFLPAYLAFLHDQYDASPNKFEPVVFDPLKRAALRKQINGWVERKTHDKIREIIPQSLPSDDTRLILVNAIYFKGLWATPFDKKLTKNAPFHVNSEESVDVPTMHTEAMFNYAENDTFQALEMPYRSNQLSMVILLPKKNDGLAELEKSLTVANIGQPLQAGSLQEVNVSLPSFKETSEFELTQPLKDLGMTSAFSGDKADFSGITDVRPFFVQAVLHKAHVDVNEEGTEAAAATGVLAAGGIPIEFNADHSFLFFIRHNPTGTILFMGRVANTLQ
jgi:serpin B